MAGKETILLLAGAGALFLVAGKKKKRKKTVNGTAKPETKAETKQPETEGEDLDREEDGVFETEEEDEDDDDEEKQTGEPPRSPAALLEKYIDPEGRARLGGLYQIKPGDTPLDICREALFGSREPTADPRKRQAAIELLIRVDCGPWNQANYAVPLSELTEGHANVDAYFTQKGISYNPIYSNNHERILNGLKPTAEPDGFWALVWIPMIDMDKFDLEGIVTTEGMNWPDTEEERGHSMIDPPRSILDLGFDEVSGTEVGCQLPEGDYRQTIVASA